MNLLVAWFVLNAGSFVIGLAVVAIVMLSMGTRKLSVWGANQVRGWMLARRDSADPEFPSPSHGADIARARAQSGQWVPARLHAKFAASVPGAVVNVTQAELSSLRALGVAQMEADGVLKSGSLDRVLGVAAARDPFAQWDGKRFVPAAGTANDPAPMAYWQRHRAWILAGFRPALGAPLIASLTLSACGSTTPAQQQSLAAAGVTLAAIAAQNNTTVASIVTKGALFCQLGGGAGIVAVVNAAGAPVTVKDQSAQAVAAACLAFQAVPVAPPVDPGAVPSMAAPAALPAVNA